MRFRCLQLPKIIWHCVHKTCFIYLHKTYNAHMKASLSLASFWLMSRVTLHYCYCQNGYPKWNSFYTFFSFFIFPSIFAMICQSPFFCFILRFLIQRCTKSLLKPKIRSKIVGKWEIKSKIYAKMKNESEILQVKWIPFWNTFLRIVINANQRVKNWCLDSLILH